MGEFPGDNPSAPLADTTIASGSTAIAPVAGTTVAATGALPAGTYEVEVTVWQSGAPDANPLNMILRRTGTTIVALPSLAAPATVRVGRYTITGNTFNVVVGAVDGGAGATYSAIIRATRVA